MTEPTICQFLPMTSSRSRADISGSVYHAGSGVNPLCSRSLTVDTRADVLRGDPVTLAGSSMLFNIFLLQSAIARPGTSRGPSSDGRSQCGAAMLGRLDRHCQHREAILNIDRSLRRAERVCSDADGEELD